MWWSIWYLLVLKHVTGGTETSFRSEEFRQSKESFQLAEEEVELIFSKIVNRLQAQTKKLRAKLPFDFAETSFKKIEDNGGKLPANVERKLRKSGVIIVRNTLPPKEAVDLASSTIEYLYQNGAFPNSTSDNDGYVKIDWSKAQLEVYQHPNMIQVQKSLLSVWNVGLANRLGVDQSLPVQFKSRVRFLQPQRENTTTGAYNGRKLWEQTANAKVTSAGADDWTDVKYRKIYQHLFKLGSFHHFDPWRIEPYLEATLNHGFRAFKGILAMSKLSPRSYGSFKVVPFLKESISYWMVRPFLKDVPEDLIPGCSHEGYLQITDTWHPDLTNSLVDLPELKPGDSVWTHPQLVIAEGTKEVTENTSSQIMLSVSFGPATLFTDLFKRHYRHAFATGGKAKDMDVSMSKDFYSEEQYEERDFQERCTARDLTSLGFKRLMGW